MSACAPPFSRQGFPTFVGHISSYRCARNFEIVKLNFFYLSVLQNELLHIYLQLFGQHFLHISIKKAAIHSLVCPLIHLYRSDLFNSLAISVTEWPEDCKNRCLSISTNSAGLHFRERVQKIKKNGKRKKRKYNVQNGQENYGGKKLAFVQNFKNNSSNFSSKLL